MMHRDTSAARVNAFREFACNMGWSVLLERDLDYGIQLQVSDGKDKVFVAFYSSGKVLIQGKAGVLRDEIQAWWNEKTASQAAGVRVPAGAPTRSGPNGAMKANPRGEPRIGLDESGKGDYFGPLVVCAVYVDGSTETRLADMGVRDSKCLSDDRIAVLAGEVTSICPYSIVLIDPARYNQLYKQFRNLNRLLAWAHASALEELLGKVSCRLAIADQFGDESFLIRALKERGRAITVEQRPRAEDDVAVAAASVLARAKFLKGIERLTEGVGRPLLKGASNPAIVTVGREIVAEKGPGALAEVAKLHFRTTQEILVMGGSGIP